MSQYIPFMSFGLNVLIAGCAFAWLILQRQSKSSETEAVLAEQLKHLASAIEGLKNELRVFDERHAASGERIRGLENRVTVLEVESGPRIKAPRQ